MCTTKKEKAQMNSQPDELINTRQYSCGGAANNGFMATRSRQPDMVYSLMNEDSLWWQSVMGEDGL